MLVNTLNNIN